MLFAQHTKDCSAENIYTRHQWTNSTNGSSQDRSEIINKYRYKNTAGFFVIPLLSQFWEEKNYCERRNELSQRRPVALPNRHKHLCLFKLGYEVHALLSSIMYILSGKKITAVYPMSRRQWDQNTTQVDNKLDMARATYVRLLHISSMVVLTEPLFPETSFCLFVHKICWCDQYIDLLKK